MKSFFTILTVLLPYFIIAQNVGINKPNPSEALDINGNINISGTLKTNGVAGGSGKVLMSTGTGLSWGSMMGYKKCVVINTPGSYNYVAPAGVTEVMVELWGAGSGGTSLCGGTSGGYARTIQFINATGIGIVVGAGSNNGATSTLNGGYSEVTFLSGFVKANGGGGVNTYGSGQPYAGSGSNMTNVFYMFGNSGSANTSTFGMKNAATYVECKKFGAGGAPVGMFNSVPVEGDVRQIENGVITYNFNSQNSFLPSAGGAAGEGSGWRGGPGMVIVWFND